MPSSLPPSLPDLKPPPSLPEAPPPAAAAALAAAACASSLKPPPCLDSAGQRRAGQRVFGRTESR
jgi:hypothetical protein